MGPLSLQNFLSKPVRHVPQSKSQQMSSKNRGVSNILEEIGFYKENNIDPNLENKKEIDMVYSNRVVENLRITYGLSSSDNDSSGSGNKSSDCDFEENF